ncbi:glycosyltransferase family 4 protein [Arthrobacter sp. zg-Y820]|uniref:glycosyltransferase family 4 protein n=1 Tax=unclassified Arthrobacter TaxID=235627 RepID=UPI001E2AFE16|nr:MULTISPECIES: glycosyltransferase family 4 protein [unclassified Arthrobacter]MCC9198018.1 glycosyltransferase family 4 protein [Arthrobacter sp. zg-Y820]MDK1280885.1 glycosyltransferase family 4 protein [Arthrobacter sp. zg.Y820]WIB10363.1 glycosyltransferase family 4 protein [Arthrobacter sp. zg-Y820]
MTLIRAWCEEQGEIETRFLNPLGKDASTGRLNVGSFFKTMSWMAFGHPDVVHLNTASRGSTYRNIIIAGVARGLGIPYVIHLHGGGYPGFISSLSHRRARLVRLYFQGSSRVIALTPSWSHFVMEILGVSSEQISVIPNGTAKPNIDGTGSSRKSLIPTFVYAGRLSVPKGVPELMRAFQELSKSSEAKLIVIGGSADNEVEALLNDAPPNVIQLGWLTNSETLTTMSEAWAVVLPSHFENMPLTVLEAMSVSTAVIATDVGGIPEVVREGIDGHLVPPRDAGALAKTMLALCDFEKALKLGSNGRTNWSKSYSSDRMAKAITELWRHETK